MATKPWKCGECPTVVFMPSRHNGTKIEGGVCTQQKRGCKGELSPMTDEEAAAVRKIMEDRRIQEQAWLTLRFADVPS